MYHMKLLYKCKYNTRRAGVLLLLRPHQNPDADRVSTIPLMSAEITSSRPLLDLPSEIWLNIFQLATFIPFETDVSVNIVKPGPFCSSDRFQIESFETVLPLRRAVVQVSRRFYQIGTEVLYTTFHANPSGVRHPYRRLSLFSDLLVLRPELGRFVKRLSLEWRDRDEEENYKIISRCPNMFIFSSLLPRDYYKHKHRRPWWGRGLPKTIRSFDADVETIPVDDVLSLLETLPRLELLDLWNLTKNLVPRAPVLLKDVRILSIYHSIYHENTSPSPPVSLAMQLPRLTTLVTDTPLIHRRLPLPLSALRRVKYFQVCGPSNYLEHHHGYFDKLRHLEIFTNSIGSWDWLTYFPLHQLDCITVNPTDDAVALWREAFKVDLFMPLDANVMPNLKRFELAWGTTGIYGYYDQGLCGIVDTEGFIESLESLVRRFEQRNIVFVEKRGIDFYPRFQPVENVLIACKWL